MANSFLGDGSSIRRIARELSELKGNRGYKEISDLLRRWRGDIAYLPSDYGEMKISGPVRFDQSNWAGAIIDEGYASRIPEYTKTLRDILNARGIPSVAAPQEEIMQFARPMSERALHRQRR